MSYTHNQVKEFIKKHFGNEQVAILEVLVKVSSLEELRQTLTDSNRTVLVMLKNSISDKYLKLLSTHGQSYDEYAEISIMSRDVDAQFILDFISANRSLKTIKTMEVLAHEKFDSDDYDSNQH